MRKVACKHGNVRGRAWQIFIFHLNKIGEINFRVVHFISLKLSLPEQLNGPQKNVSYNFSKNLLVYS